MKKYKSKVLENSAIETEFDENTIVVEPSEELPELNTTNTCITKREVNRSSFTVGIEIGSGNFGKVFKGDLLGLYSSDSKTTVAMKSIGGQKVNEDELENLFISLRTRSFNDNFVDEKNKNEFDERTEVSDLAQVNLAGMTGGCPMQRMKWEYGAAPGGGCPFSQQ